MTLHPIPLNFLINEENFIFYFIRVGCWDGIQRLNPKKNMVYGTPIPELTITPPFVDSHACTMGNHLSRLYPPVKDLGFGLWTGGMLQWQSDALTTRLDLIHYLSQISSTSLARSHPLTRLDLIHYLGQISSISFISTGFLISVFESVYTCTEPCRLVQLY